MQLSTAQNTGKQLGGKGIVNGIVQQCLARYGGKGNTAQSTLSITLGRGVAERGPLPQSAAGQPPTRRDALRGAAAVP